MTEAIQTSIPRVRQRALRSAGLLVLALASPVALAQAFFEAPGEFRLDKACTASSSIRGGAGAVALAAGSRHKALAENAAEQASHVFIEVDGQRKWLGLDCGSYVPARPAHKGRPAAVATTDAAACPPFFDERNNPVPLRRGSADITPPPPPLDAFDQAVARFCGAPGSKTRRNGFVQLMREHPQVLAGVMAYTGGKVFPSRRPLTDSARYLDDLSEAWYEEQGFDHIFCGELERGKIGGLHWQGRYQQLQASGEACRLDAAGKGEVVPGATYSMGVRMKAADGRWASHDIKGYGLSLSAADLLKAATRAFAENPVSGRDSAACLLPLRDGKAEYNMVFVSRKAGIRTFYPDATPDRGRTEACSRALVLE